MLRFIRKKVSSERDKFIAQLIIGAYFYVIRSYEYCKTPGEPQSIIITTDHINFMLSLNKCLINISSSNSKATSVQIVFGIQKNLEMEEPVSNY